MFATKEIEAKVIDKLKNIVDDDIKEIDKKYQTVKFTDGSIYYILTNNQECDYFYKTELGFECFVIPELLSELTGLNLTAFEKLKGYNEEIGILIDTTMGINNYMRIVKGVIESGHLIAYDEKEKIRLSRGYSAFRLK